MSPKDEQTLVQTTANKGRRKAKPPPEELGELGDWKVRLKLTETELQRLDRQAREIYQQIRGEERAIDGIQADARDLVKRKKEGIDKLKDRGDRVTDQVDTGLGEERPVRCYRQLVDGEVVFIGLDGAELYRRPQLREQQELPMVELPEPSTGWPWCEPSWHPFARERQAETQLLLDELRAHCEQGDWPPERLNIRPEWRDACSPEVREVWPVHPQLWFREILGDPLQRASTCGAYQVRREGGSWVALHGEDRLWDQNLGDTYPDPETAIWRCCDCAEVLAEGQRLTAEARAVHQERMRLEPSAVVPCGPETVAVDEAFMAKLKANDPKRLLWRKERGVSAWSTRPEPYRITVDAGRHVARYGTLATSITVVGQTEPQPGESPRKALQRAQALCQEHHDAQP